jgi:Flagellar hook-length control protein FliK
MDIVGSVPGASTLTLTDATPSISWRVGQHLDAVVTGIIGRDKVTLNIDGAMLEAHTSVATSTGQRLHLEVIRSDSQIVLRIISPTPTSNPLTAALREALPHQQPLQAVFSRLASLLSPSSGLSATTTILLKQLVGQLPTQHTISQVDVLKRALMDSGLFLEHKLSLDPKPSTLAADLKANLLRLLAETNQGRDESASALAQHVEAGLARIQLHQLSALADMQTSVTTWTGELPVRHDHHVNVFQFHIEKDAKTATNPERQSWCTWLSFNIKFLGPMYVRIILTNKNVAATLWAELTSTVDVINQNLSLLHRSLGAVGLEIKDLRCLQGSPPFPVMKHLPTGLLDITA